MKSIPANRIFVSQFANSGVFFSLLAISSQPPLPSQDQAALLSKRALRGPAQVELIHNYFQNNATAEGRAYGLLLDILDHAPALEQELVSLEAERAQRIREAQEMAENMTRTEPLFLRYDVTWHSK